MHFSSWRDRSQLPKSATLSAPWLSLKEKACLQVGHLPLREVDTAQGKGLNQ
jgi:hypothetical protein